MKIILILLLIIILLILFFCINGETFVNISDNINTLDQYNYYQSNDDEYIYYVNIFYNDQSLMKTRPLIFNASSFYMDGNKNVIQCSRNIFYQDHRNEIPDIYKVAENITEEQINNATYIGENIIGVTKWPILYGHVHDEMYLLYDFYDKMSKKNKEINYTILYEFMTDNNIINYPHENIGIIHKYLFDNINTINPYTLNYNIIKMKKVMIIHNFDNGPVFHSFPLSASHKILSKINDTNIINKNVYISRGKCLHGTNRNLNNDDEISDYLLSNNYVIINPEKMLFDDFVNNIRHADNVVITWGSALTNMVYLKENTNVYILRAQGYDPEPNDYFDKIIKNYNLNVKMIRHSDNKIVIPFL